MCAHNNSQHTKQANTRITIMSHLLYTEHCPLLYSESPPPVPDNLPSGQEGAFIRSFDDRLWLFQRQWIPPNNVKCTLMILHGTVDHSGVYHELAMALNTVGIAVVCTDMRGWGLSDGESYYFHNIQVFVEDVVAQYNDLSTKNKPCFLLGKSIGGLIAAYVCAQHPTLFSGLIGLSGAFEIEGMPSAALETMLNGLAMLAPKLPLKALMDSEQLVSDEAAQQQWEQDVLVRRGRLTVGYITEILRCIHELPTRTASSEFEQLPKLLLWGTDDHVVTRAGHEQMQSGQHATIHIYPGGRHNLLAEPALKDRVVGDIRDWILAQVKQ